MAKHWQTVLLDSFRLCPGSLQWGVGKPPSLSVAKRSLGTLAWEYDLLNPKCEGGDKIDRSPRSTLLALLAPRRLAHLEKYHAPLWKRRDECPEATPELVCYDEVVVECDAEQAAVVKVWLEKAMADGMDAIMYDTDEVDVPVEGEARLARRWGEGD